MSDRSTPPRSGFFWGLLVGAMPMILICAGIPTLGMVLDWRGDRQTAVAPVPSLPVIDEASAADLLPAQRPSRPAAVYLGDDLSNVPELALEDIKYETRKGEWQERKARMTALALHLNTREQDGFLKNLLERRPDLAGLPFAMGGACRMAKDSAAAFKTAVRSVRQSDGSNLLKRVEEDDAQRRLRQDESHLAAIRQIMPGESVTDQISLLNAVSSVPRSQATTALARFAVYAMDEEVRTRAIEALSVRREEGTREVFAAALNYPWPGVARNAAAAIVQLRRKDLIPDLEAVLEAPDPRGPVTETVSGSPQTVARELVRVNHLRNCLLCHAPARRSDASEQTLVAEMPVPGESLPITSRYYDDAEQRSNLLVRVDVTYLRQDFSAMQKVTDRTADNWTVNQRFDFLVRKRVLSDEEAADLSRRLSGVSTYRQIAAAALRQLTGGEAPPPASPRATGRRSSANWLQEFRRS